LLLAGKLKLVRDYTIIVSAQQRVSAGLRDLCEGRWHADQEHGSSDQDRAGDVGDFVERRKLFSGRAKLVEAKHVLILSV
jgi:hypothetical protein